MASVAARRSLAVVMPAYDEAANLRGLLPGLHAVLASLDGYDTTVLVVLRRDASDEELREVRALGAVPVPRDPSDSFGDAIRSGILALPVDVDHVVFMDADGSHRPETIPRLLEHAEGHDVVVASRYVAGGQTDNGTVLRVMSRSLNTCFRLVLGIPCHDVSTNFKLYRADQVRAVTLTCENFDIVEELLFRLHRHVGKDRFRLHEVPDYFHERDLGTSKRQLGPFIASYLVTLARLRLSAARDTA